MKFIFFRRKDTCFLSKKVIEFGKYKFMIYLCIHYEFKIIIF